MRAEASTPEGPRSIFVDVRVHPLRDANGAVWGVLVQGLDTTRETQALKALQAREHELEEALAAYQAILDNSHDVICVFDSDGVIQQVNRHTQAAWGYTAEELIGRNYIALVHPEDREASVRFALRARMGRPATGFLNRYRRKDGTYTPMMWSVGWSERFQRGYGIARDMHEWVAAEERLRQAQKMEAIGRLTGGLAHDFNNILTVVMSGSEAMLQNLPPRSPHREMAELTLNAAERGADLVERLLSFSRNRSPKSETIDCRALMDGVAPLIRQAIGERVTLTVETPQELYCRASRSQLESALLNLCINARDAMPEGGEIRIKVSAVRRPSGDPEIGLREERDFVCIAVTDTGVGMSPSVADRALEPFFTTKDGQGSGLGLSMVYGFVSQAGGDLTIDTAEGQGTTVTLCLPMASGLTAQSAEADPDIPPDWLGRRILLVDDDELVSRQLHLQLLALGFQVRPARDAAAALRVLEGDEDIALMLTDVVMPGMDGVDLAAAAGRIRPELKVMFTTAYARGEDSGRALPANAVVLHKPYRRGRLIALLMKMLPPGRVAGD
ncbi:PAS domain S-box protein [Phenylobacterium sp. J426]|uniref:PAS domain S-box protein n=1 Tax=Phenylobacterium sp. J426 TaxID=2898439 RepID=UPI002151E337|nr:PAS domain S-box protein [Phenylobacterium sp. J426]MCR5873036.1 PAS domain S-box protein [Phenylobacterium sp. J426]